MNGCAISGGAVGHLKSPSGFTILFVLIAVVAGLTWIVPAGLYDMAMNEALAREAPLR